MSTYVHTLYLLCTYSEPLRSSLLESNIASVVFNISLVASIESNVIPKAEIMIYSGQIWFVLHISDLEELLYIDWSSFGCVFTDMAN